MLGLRLMAKKGLDAYKQFTQKTQISQKYLVATREIIYLTQIAQKSQIMNMEKVIG